MKDIEKILKQDYENACERVKDAAINGEAYELELKERDNIRNEMIKLKELEFNYELKDKQLLLEDNAKMDQIKSDEKKEKHRNLITIGTYLGTTVIGVGTLIASFKFDKVATFTSTVGRHSVLDHIDKIFKFKK